MAHNFQIAANTLEHPFQKAELSTSTSLDGLEGLIGSQSREGVGSTPPSLGEVQQLTTNYTINNDYTNLIFTNNSLVNFDLVDLQPVGNTLATAYDLDTLTGVKTRTGDVGADDTVDYYRFDLTAIRDVTLTLSELDGDARLRLIHDKNNNNQIDAGEAIAISNRSDTFSEAINQILGQGTYFAEIQQDIGASGYTLKNQARLPQVSMDVTRVKAIDNPDTGIFWDDADYYSKITIDGSTNTTGEISNNNDISPSHWSHTRTVDGTSRYVNIAIEIFDKDGDLIGGSDDRIDVDSKTNYRDINVTYDLLTNQVTGDVSGLGGTTLSSTGAGDANRAIAWFKVKEGDWYDRNLGDVNLRNIVRNLASDGIARNDMITFIRDTKDYGSMTATELTDLRRIVSDFSMPEYVNNLANKVVNSDVANTWSGIGNLYAGSTDTQIESLVGKWFLGSDRPTALSYDRTQAFSYSYAEGSLFQNGISYDDVDQGNLGDCYFLASLAGTARQAASRISNMFTDNGDGTFTVRFFKPDGSRDYVTVDRYLPTNTWGGKVFAGWGGGHISSTTNELWVALAEKAYAQINESGWIGQDGTNSYNGITLSSTGVEHNSEGINGGWSQNTTNQITGLITHQETTTDKVLWWTISDDADEMIAAFNAGKIITLSTQDAPSESIVDYHAYSLVGYDAGSDRFTLYNPWGSTITLSRQEVLDNFTFWEYSA